MTTTSAATKLERALLLADLQLDVTTWLATARRALLHRDREQADYALDRMDDCLDHLADVLSRLDEG